MIPGGCEPNDDMDIVEGARLGGLMLVVASLALVVKKTFDPTPTSLVAQTRPPEVHVVAALCRLRVSRLHVLSFRVYDAAATAASNTGMPPLL